METYKYNGSRSVNTLTFLEILWLMDPDWHFNPIPIQESRISVDPCGSGSSTWICTQSKQKYARVRINTVPSTLHGKLSIMTLVRSDLEQGLSNETRKFLRGPKCTIGIQQLSISQVRKEKNTCGTVMLRTPSSPTLSMGGV